MLNIKKFIIHKDQKLFKALKLINKNKEKTCFIVDKNRKLIGSLTDGDVRRKILNKKNINHSVYNFCNKNCVFLFKDKIKSLNLKKFFQKKKIELIPVLNSKKIIVNILFKENFFNLKANKGKIVIKKNLSKIKVVIMAGGKGTRLDPITKVFPKPLVPIKNKTAIECIIDSFLKFNIKNFYFTLNYKPELIKAYFKNIKKNYKINYLEEKKPLGTAGSLAKIKTRFKDNFFLTNCDVIFNFDYNDLLQFHIKNNSDMTIVVSKESVEIPYGVCGVNKFNKINKIIEKPKISNLITTGLYVINPKIIKTLKANKHLDMNKFISSTLSKKFKVEMYKIKKSSWYDIGQLKDYKKKINLLSG